MDVKDFEKLKRENMELSMMEEEAQAYAKRVKLENEQLNEKVSLLKSLILLTNEQVSHEIMGDLQCRQWREFTSQFPDEE